MKKLLIISAILSLLLAACKSHEIPVSTMAYQSHATECIGSDPSGSVRLRVWGEGKDRKSAQENARKKAVEEVVFNNITAGSAKGNSWPVIDNPTVRRNNADYFSKFFKDGGGYKKFIKAEKPEKEDFLSGNSNVIVPMEITVDKEGLRKKFIKDGILK